MTNETSSAVLDDLEQRRSLLVAQLSRCGATVNETSDRGQAWQVPTAGSMFLPFASEQSFPARAETLSHVLAPLLAIEAAGYHRAIREHLPTALEHSDPPIIASTRPATDASTGMAP